ncbi:hypothetical protein PUN28_003519 [Cardiocondyla obscurior]|uniref:Histone H3 n=1 Tax=Cardiocondyla obscurior TaxID=286306 RepID=A0AAW2GKT9_9HYME
MARENPACDGARSLKLARKKETKNGNNKKSSPGAKFFAEGHRRRPCGRRALLPHPSLRVKGDQRRRKNPRATIGSRDRMRATGKHPYRSRRAKRSLSPPPFPPPSRSLSLPFVEGAQLRTQDHRRLRRGPQRRCRRRPSPRVDRPTAPFPVL